MPKRRWEDSVKIYLKEAGRQYAGCIRAGQTGTDVSQKQGVSVPQTVLTSWVS
jgi:hypothetical protein